MRRIFLALSLLWLALYVIALSTMEADHTPGKIHLLWATDSNPARARQIETFERMYPQYEVSIDPGLGGNQDKLVVKCATGVGPDIIDVYSVGQMQTYVEAGLLLDITGPARRNGFTPADTFPAMRELITLEGRQYRFPCNLGANAVIFNKAIFDDHGVPYPEPGWTYDDFIRTALAIKNNPSRSGDAHIPVVNCFYVMMFEDLLAGRGVDYFRDGGLASNLDSPEAIEVMRFYHDLILEHGIMSTQSEMMNASAQGGWANPGISLFYQEQAAMIFLGRFFTVQLPNYPDLAGKLGAVTLPRFKGMPSRGLCRGRAAAVNARSENSEGALKFLEYLASPQYSRIIAEEGDSLPPNPAIARTGKDLATRHMPDPAFHQVFIDAVNNSVGNDLSPYFDLNLLVGAYQLLSQALDLVENRARTPEEAMRMVASEVNGRILRNLETNPVLRERYRRQTGRDFTGDPGIPEEPAVVDH